MEQPKNKRLVLTSVNQIITLDNTNPNISSAVPKLASLGKLQKSVAPQKSCNCGAKRNITTPDVNKQLAENTLSSLTPEDFTAIKNALDLDQLCYYKRSLADNSLELICV
jgi:hypothetical protein